MKCPECKAKMLVVSKKGATDEFQFECFRCGYVEPEEVFVKINDGTMGPIMLHFKDESEFVKAMDENQYNLQVRTVNEIERSFGGVNDYIIIAYLNDRGSILGITEEEYLDHLDQAREYFEEVEDYKMCIRCRDLSEKLKEDATKKKKKNVQGKRAKRAK